MGPLARGILGAAALFIAFLALLQILWPLKWRWVATWLVVEAIFYITVWLPRYDKFNKQPECHEPCSHDALKAWNRFLRYCKETPGGLDYKAYIKGWFRGAKFDDIKRGNAEEFVAYGFWYRSLEQMQQAGVGYIPGQMVEDLERLWNIKLPPGYNPNVKFMGHLWEPLSVVWCYRPLIFYCSTEGLGRLGRMLLKHWGFNRHHHNGLAYFTLNIQKPQPKSAINSSSNSDSSSDMPASATAARLSGVESMPESGCDMPVAEWAAEESNDILLGSEARPQQDVHMVPSATGHTLAAAAGKDAAAGLAAAAAAADVNAQLDQGVHALSSVFESCTPAGIDEWTPFAASSSGAESLATSLGDLPPAEEAARMKGAKLALNSSAGASATLPTPHHSRDSSIGGSSMLVHCSGPRPHAFSVPISPPPVWPADSPRAAAAAGDSAGPKRSSSMQHQRTSALLMAQTLPQLAPRTSALLANLACPLQEVLSVTGLDQCQQGTPMLFLHGVGGLPAYLELVMHLMATQHPVLAVECKGVALRLSKVYTADDVAAIVVGILDRMQIKQACVVAHSYGTFIASLLVRRYPQRVASVCLVDPVCFGMFMPNLLYNFLYRPLELNAWDFSSLMHVWKAAVRKVASNELHLRTTFSRAFYWTELNLWPEDLPAGSVVVLSGKDDLLDAEAVKSMLECAGHVQVVWNQELTHGAFLLIPEVKAAVLQNIMVLLAASGSAVAGLAEGLTSLVSHRQAARTSTTPLSSSTKQGASSRAGEGWGLMRALTSIKEAEHEPNGKLKPHRA